MNVINSTETATPVLKDWFKLREGPSVAVVVADLDCRRVHKARVLRPKKSMYLDYLIANCTQ